VLNGAYHEKVENDSEVGKLELNLYRKGFIEP
jgi:hypothetical protein